MEQYGRRRSLSTQLGAGDVLVAYWSFRSMSLEWTVDFDFRASGPERGGGNLQVWYTKDGEAAIGPSSIYTVGKFDGLAMVIDTHGSRVCTRCGMVGDQ